jgi:HAD superfamily hydrolase (TIGR01450 family)
MGFDTELEFKKLEDACILLNRGVDYIATNPDLVCPTYYGFVPDCGSVAKMLENATGRVPVFIGKPQPQMVYLAMKKTGFKKEEKIIIGDRLYTDIKCGINAGISSALVLSGETTRDMLEKSDDKPAFVFENIKKLHESLVLKSD